MARWSRSAPAMANWSNTASRCCGYARAEVAELRRVLIANRGEIALRIMRSCRKLGLETVLAVSEAAGDSLPARRAAGVICTGPAPASQSYLRPDTIMQAALSTGAD